MSSAASGPVRLLRRPGVALPPPRRDQARARVAPRAGVAPTPPPIDAPSLSRISADNACGGAGGGGGGNGIASGGGWGWGCAMAAVAGGVDVSSGWYPALMISRPGRAKKLRSCRSNNRQPCRSCRVSGSTGRNVQSISSIVNAPSLGPGPARRSPSRSRSRSSRGGSR